MNSERQYAQAFNNGYILAQYEPKLLNTISKTLAPTTNNYLEGFLAGKEQLEFENGKNKLLELQKLRYQSYDRNKYNDKDY